MTLTVPQMLGKTLPWNASLRQRLEQVGLGSAYHFPHVDSAVAEGLELVRAIRACNQPGTITDVELVRWKMGRGVLGTESKKRQSQWIYWARQVLNVALGNAR